MKHTPIRKRTQLTLVLVLGFLLAPTVPVYGMHQHSNQFDNNHYQYQVYTAPVQTQYQSQYYNQNIQLLLQQIAQLQQLLWQLQGGVVIDEDDTDDAGSSYDSEVEVDTRSATDIQDDSARLRGEVTDFNRSDYADVWFEYGRSRSDLDTRTPITRIDEDEDQEFVFRVVGLRNDTRYYFRAVAEDEDEEKNYGSIFDFRTDDRRGSYYDDDYRDGDDEPDVTTRNAFDIDDDSAWFAGDVDMNDYRNGEVFFVYGEDEDQIDDVAGDFDTYRDVDEDGDDLQKFRVDSDLDGDSSYKARVSGLDDNTGYYFALCVGYEDEDNDDVLECSSTRDFETGY